MTGMQYQKNLTGQTKVLFPEQFYRGEFRCDFFITSLMKRCWAAQIEVLAEIDRICRKYDIAWYADGGTLLGAVRHKGFIPWDDDVDIAMIRKDYNRFLFYAEKELGEDYSLYKRHEDAKFDDVFARVVNDRGLRRRGDYKWCHGCVVYAGVDIFPLDYIPRDPKEENLLISLSTLLELARQEIKKGKRDFETLNEIERICQIRFDRNGDMNKQLGDVFEEVCQWYTEEESDELTLFPYIVRHPEFRLKKEWYEETVLLDFETLKLPCPAGYHETLILSYGDYQTWEKFTGLHDYPYYKPQLKEYEKSFCEDVKRKTLKALGGFWGISPSRIRHLEMLKCGYRNYTMRFKLAGDIFAIRIPDESVKHIMDRTVEEEIYSVLKPYDVTDELYYFSAVNGNKISLYLEHTRPCDIREAGDVALCMEALGYIHSLDVKVNGSFELLDRIDAYEEKWGDSSYFPDYRETKAKIRQLCCFIDGQEKHWGLTHFDLTADDFLIQELDGRTDIRLVDWEYAGMQDTDIDLAMFALRAGYSKEELDWLIDIYFGKKSCPSERRVKIYAYMGACALFLSNYYEYYDRKGKEMIPDKLRFYETARLYYDMVFYNDCKNNQTVGEKA